MGERPLKMFLILRDEVTVGIISSGAGVWIWPSGQLWLWKCQSGGVL